MKRISLHPDHAEAYESWIGLLDLADRLPDEWSLAGGQMVYSHAVEHNVEVPRPSDDADVVIDIRGHREASENIFRVLQEIGFESEGFDFAGRRHRWVRGDAQIDVLQPRHLGDRKERALKRRNLLTIGAPGAQHLLSRSELVEVQIIERVSLIRRPDLMGAISAKCAAYRDIVTQAAPERHLVDILTLTPLLSTRVLREAEPWKRLEQERIRFAARTAIPRHERYLLQYFPHDLEARVDRLRMLGELSAVTRA